VNGRRRRARCLAFAQSQVMRGDDHACGEALEIPFPQRRYGLIEVIDVEDDLPLGSGKAAEIQQVGISAGLDPDP